MTLREHLAQEPFTLALSSGFFGFFAHYGFSLALREAGLKPARVTGASAGAVLAAAWSCDLPDHELKSVLQELKRETFWDPSPGFGFLKGKRLESFLREVFHRREPELPIAISTFDILKCRTASFSDGDIPRLVRASCAVPMMFHPVKIKDRYYWDGGILDKAALVSVKPGERVLSHYLPGQGIHRFYESRKELANLRGRHFVVVPEKLPQVGPYKLQDGLLAVERAYEHAQRCLNARCKSLSQ